MRTESLRSEDPEISRRKWPFIALCWFIVLIIYVFAIDATLHRHDLPVWVRTLLALIALVPFAALAHAHWRMVTTGDELVRHIARETYVFSFYILLAVFVSVDLMKSCGVLPAFTWGTRELIYAMIYALAASHAFARWRYR
jgi:hypothetical protein